MAAVTAIPDTDGEPAHRPVQIRTERHAGTATVLTCRGDIDLNAVPVLRQAFTDALDALPDVVLDMAGVALIDSTGLGLLVRTRQAARQRGGVLCLAAPSRFVRTVLHTMRLDGAFPIFDDPAAALDWLRGVTSDEGDGPPAGTRPRGRQRESPAWPCTTNPAASRLSAPMEREKLR